MFTHYLQHLCIVSYRGNIDIQKLKRTYWFKISMLKILYWQQFFKHSYKIYVYVVYLEILRVTLYNFIYFKNKCWKSIHIKYIKIIEI